MSNCEKCSEPEYGCVCGPDLLVEDKEFDLGERRLRRSDKEHPEQAYRRGYQQGAAAVMRVRDPSVVALLDFDEALHKWRYSGRRRQRDVLRDRPPGIVEPDE